MTSTPAPARAPEPAVRPDRGEPAAPTGGDHAGVLARVRGGVAAAIVAAAWLPAVLAALLLDAADPDWDRPVRVIVVALVYAPVAAVMVARGRPAVAVILGVLAVHSGWLALLVALRTSGDALAEGAAIAEVLSSVLLWPRVPEVAALTILPWLLTARRTRLRTAGIAAGLAAVGYDALLATAVAVTGSPMPGALLAAQVASLVLFVAGCAALVVEWRRAPGPRRDALAWLALGGALLVASAVPIIARLPDPAATLGTAAFVLASGVLPSAILVTVLGREVGLDRRLFTATVWVQAIAVALALSLVVREAATALGLDPTVAGALAAGALALAFASVSTFVRRRTERMAAGETVDARRMLRNLGGHLAEAPDPAAGLRGLAEALRATWALDSVAIRSDSGGSGVLVGTPGVARLAVDLSAGGRRVGTVEVSAARPEPLERAVRPALDEVAGLIAVAVLLADLNHEVAETRRRMLGVRREERRLLHRELHDELAPSIAGLGYGIAAATRLVHAGSPGAADAVARLREDVAERAEEVRRLARALLPAALDEGDLDAALHELARRSAAEGVRVRVDASGADVLEDRAQLAVYLLAADAVREHRTGEHDGGALDVAVRIRERSVLLRIDLEGGDAGAVERLRTRLAERAGELGATVRADAASGAAAVEVVVPR